MRGYRGGNVAGLTLRPPSNCGHQTEAPAVGLFFCLVLGGYMLATRCKTLYRWLHGGYMTRKTKNPATELIAGFPLFTW